MATNIRAATAGGLVLILAVYFLVASGKSTAAGENEGLWKPFLTEAELDKIVADEVAILNKELAKPKPDDKRIRASGLVIALAAHDCKDPGKPLATLRGSALDLVQGKIDSAGAKKLVEQIANYKKQNGKAPSASGPIDLKKAVEELGDAMVVFDKPEKGGEGLERDLLILGQQKKPFTPAQMSDKQLVLADKAALIAQVARAFDDLGKNQKQDWLKFTDEMRQGSLDLAAAIKAKNNKGMKTSLNKLYSACVNCHEKFRDKDK